MATIVGVEVDEGTTIAGDRLLAEDGTVKSEDKRHIFDFGEVGAAAVGSSGGVDEFRRRLGSEIQSYETERGEEMGVTRLANTAAEIAQETDVEAIVVGHDDEGRASLRAIGTGGSVLTDETVAFGSGTQFALGVLDGSDLGSELDDAEALARDAIASAASRDTGTGEEVDVYRLASEQ